MTTVLVMVKSPEPGRVKTRLCPPCTLDEAAALAAAAITDTFAAVAASGAARRIVALDGAVGDFIPSGFEVIAQRGASFNERLERAWSTTRGPTLQIGMDTPQITAELIDTSLATLTAGGVHRAVLGDAEDGGWWALGLHAARPGCFEGVAMSAATTGAEQRSRLEGFGLEVVGLPMLRDVDLIGDAGVVAESAPATHFARLLAQLDIGGRRFAGIGGPR
jgi:glycosyltransferase A (GT-A) superfamily protein (DUF2064 family)